MNRKELTDFLNSLEQKYPVNEWRLDGVDIWPIVKFNIFVQWRAYHHRKYNSMLRKGGATDINNKPVPPKSLLSSLKTLWQLKQKKETHFPLLLAGANSHRIDFEGQFVNRYFQPVTEYLEDKKQDFLLVEYEPRLASKKYPSENHLIFLDDYLPAAKFIQSLKLVAGPKTLKGFDEFFQEVRNKIPDVVKNKKYLKIISARVKELKAYALVFDILIQKHKPHRAIGLCYYNMAMYAMNYVAHKNNIGSVDVQHGSIGYTHPAYSSYSKVPVDGYNVMPKVFWCWDEASSRAIETWTQKQNFHKTVLGGNPWLTYFGLNDKNVYDFPKKKKIILYTMQFNFPETFIVEAIRKSSNEYEWWLRLHPRTGGIKHEMEEFLQKENIAEKVNLHQATQYPLQKILLNSVIHISRSSGSIIEAAQIGVKSIVINEIGVDNYRDYIESGEAIPFLDGSADDLLQIISANEVVPGTQHGGHQYDYRNVINEFLKK
jgi:hypothetical protein